MGTIRLGKRTEGRSPKIHDFVPLASINDPVFTGWDIFEDDMYTAAGKVGSSALCGIGIQEWLSFYFKSAMTAEGLYPEHDLFIQWMKLKNTLRHLIGEKMITHLGLEYYDRAHFLRSIRFMHLLPPPCIGYLDRAVPTSWQAASPLTQ